MAERGRARTQGVAGTWPPREAAPAGGFAPSGFGAWSSFVEKLRTWIRAVFHVATAKPAVIAAIMTAIGNIFCRRSKNVAAQSPVAATAAAGKTGS